MPVIRARGYGERRVDARTACSSSHRSEEYANSPWTFSVPSGRGGLVADRRPRDGRSAPWTSTVGHRASPRPSRWPRPQVGRERRPRRAVRSSSSLDDHRAADGAAAPAAGAGRGRARRPGRRCRRGRARRAATGRGRRACPARASRSRRPGRGSAAPPMVAIASACAGASATAGRTAGARAYSAWRSSSPSRPASCDAAPSTPSPTGPPASSRARTGAMPAPSRPLEDGQWATPVPVAPSAGDLRRRRGAPRGRATRRRRASRAGPGTPPGVQPCVCRQYDLLVEGLGEVGVQPDAERPGQRGRLAHQVAGDRERRARARARPAPSRRARGRGSGRPPPGSRPGSRRASRPPSPAAARPADWPRSIEPRVGWNRSPIRRGRVDGRRRAGRRRRAGTGSGGRWRWCSRTAPASPARRRRPRRPRPRRAGPRPGTARSATRRGSRPGA